MRRRCRRKTAKTYDDNAQQHQAISGTIVAVNALLLFAHGSTLCGSGESLEAHAESLRARNLFPIVQIGYLNYTDPLFPEAVDSLVARGVTEITVAPYFLIKGYFVTNSLPKEIARATERHPSLRFTVTDALQTDDLLADAILSSALAAKPADQWRAPLARATAFCRPLPTCPLYGTSSCPKVPALPAEENA